MPLRKSSLSQYAKEKSKTDFDCGRTWVQASVEWVHPSICLGQVAAARINMTKAQKGDTTRAVQSALLK